MHRNRYRNPQQRRGDKVTFGLIIVLVGVALLLQKFHIRFFNIHDVWPVLLILLGLFVGIKHGFRNNGWWIMMFIGTIFLIPPFMFMGVSSTELVWPAAFIVGGLCIALKPNRKKQFLERMQANTTADNTLNVDVTFGGRKEIVTSKDFRGGNVATTFAGSEINLMQADSTVQPMELNIKVAFGGVELIVPSHWDVIVEIQPSFGSVEDHRMVRTPAIGEEKRTLILRGSVSFGSVEIKSY